MNAKDRSPITVSWGLMGQRRWPLLFHVPEAQKADGQPAASEHADVLSASPDGSMPSESVLTYGELTRYPALAVYLDAQRVAQERKDDAYAAAVDHLGQDGDYVTFLAALAAASREYRATLREALRKLRDAIGNDEVMDEAEAAAFWYWRGLENQDEPAPAA
jgi:hypothetical protein